jgi:ADP-heptose:LPS heptosyltransferase
MAKDGTQITLAVNARILVVKPRAGIGDFVLLMPAIRALRNTYPEARIDVLVSSGLQAFIERKSIKELRLFDNVIISPKKIPPRFSVNPLGFPSWNPEFIAFSRLLYDLHSTHYDAVLLFQYIEAVSHIEMMRMIVEATDATWKVGLENGQGTFLNVKVPHLGFGVKHQAEYAIEVVEAVGAVVGDRSLFFPLDEEECQQAQMLLWGGKRSPASRPLIAMHPGCASYMKARRWRPERFAQLADMVYGEFGGVLILLGGADELPLREQIASSMQSAMPTHILSGQESIGLVAATMKQCDLFIGNDSGLMHVSAAVGIPTVGIFGLTNHKAWGPYMPLDSGKSMIARLDLPCMPCAYVGHSSGNIEGCATVDCLNQLTAHIVAETVRRLIYENYGSDKFFRNEKGSEVSASIS